MAPDGFRYVGFAKDSQTDGKPCWIYGQLAWAMMPTLELTARAMDP